jgi:hypothetical protein
MNLITRAEQSLSVKMREMSVSDVAFYSILVMLTHLTLLFSNMVQMHRAITDHIPAHLNTYTSFDLYLNAASSLVAEVLMFLLGWLFITGAIMLLNGQENARALFWWLGLCFLPVALLSLASCVILLFNLGAPQFTPIAQAQTEAELAAAIGESVSRGTYWWLLAAGKAAYGVTAVMIIEAIHRVCRVTRLKAVLVLASYGALLFALDFLIRRL